MPVQQGGFWRRTYVIHPGIGVARIGNAADVCQPFLAEIDRLKEEIDALENALDADFPLLPEKQRAKKRALLADDQNKLAQATSSARALPATE